MAYIYMSQAAVEDFWGAPAFTNHQETSGLQDFIFIYFGLHWVFIAMCGLSLAEASEGFSLQWLLLLQSTGSRASAQ